VGPLGRVKKASRSVLYGAYRMLICKRFQGRIHRLYILARISNIGMYESSNHVEDG
jgi:hypothetical protein